MANFWLFIRKNLLLTVALTIFVSVAAVFALRNPLDITPDETYHYAIIQAYSEQYSPFITKQFNTAQTNDIIRLPSYMYHYLLSFPYRMLQALDLPDQTILISLRLVNVALGVGTIFLLRKLLYRLTTPRAATIATAIFAMLPITMITFGGLNYDNAMLPVAFVSILLLLSVKQHATLPKTLLLVGLLQFGCLIKYTFLPIAAVIFIYLLVLLWQQKKVVSGWRFTASPIVLALGFFLLIMTGLFAERYGVNIVRYHDPAPPCTAIHSLQECLTFPINKRDYDARLDGIEASKNPAVYLATDWYKNIVRGLIYPSPFLFLRYAFLAFVVIATAAILVHRNHGHHDSEFGWFIVGMCTLYIATVMVNNYAIYKETGFPYAINGRYLLPVLPFVVAIAWHNIEAMGRKLAIQTKRYAEPILPSTRS